MPPSLQTSAAAIATMSRAEWAQILGGDPAAAAEWLQAAAALDVAEAQTVLGQWYLEGRGLPVDQAAACKWFARGARHAHPMAMNMLGRCSEHGWGVAADPEAAARWYRSAADAGLEWGMYNLANLLATGRGVAQDQPAALAWYRRAAERGHARSMNMVGRYLEEGLAIPRDPAAALQWYRRSAEAGDFRGQFSYASMLADAGLITQSLGWFRKVPAGATPAFALKTAQSLAASPLAPLREAGLRMLAELPGADPGGSGVAG